MVVVMERNKIEVYFGNSSTPKFVFWETLPATLNGWILTQLSGWDAVTQFSYDTATDLTGKEAYIYGAKTEARSINISANASFSKQDDIQKLQKDLEGYIFNQTNVTLKRKFWETGQTVYNVQTLRGKIYGTDEPVQKGLNSTFTLRFLCPEPRIEYTTEASTELEDELKKEKIQISMGNTLLNVNSYIEQNPEGPFEISNFEALVETEPGVLMSMVIVGNSLKITAYMENFDYSIINNVTIPETVNPDQDKINMINNSMNITIANVNSYISANPNGPFELSNFEPLKYEEGIASIIMTIVGNSLNIKSSIAGWTGYIRNETVSIPEIVDPGEEQAKIDAINHSMNTTVTNVNNYISANPEGPFELSNFETLKYEEGGATISMNIVNNVLNIRSYVADFNSYERNETVTIPEVTPEPPEEDPFAQNSVFYYPLQENVNDFNNNEMNGVNHDVVFVNEGPVTQMKSAKFTGTEYIKVPPMNPDWSQGFTFSLFIKWDEIWEYGPVTDFSIGPNNYNILFSPYSNQQITHLVFNYDQPQLFNTGFVPVVGEWYMFTISIRSSDNATFFFVNGNYSGTYMQNFALPANIERTENYIGAQSYHAPDFNTGFKGNIAHVRLWNRYLNSQEISNLYNYCINGFV